MCVSKGDILAVPSLLLHHFSYETFVCTVASHFLGLYVCGAFLVLLLKEKKAFRDPPGRSCVTAARWNEKGRTSHRELFFRGLKKEGWREKSVCLSEMKKGEHAESPKKEEKEKCPVLGTLHTVSRLK